MTVEGIEYPATKTHTETQRHTQTHMHTHRHTHRHKDTHTDIYADTHRDKHRHRHTHTNTDTSTETHTAGPSAVAHSTFLDPLWFFSGSYCSQITSNLGRGLTSTPQSTLLPAPFRCPSRPGTQHCRTLSNTAPHPVTWAFALGLLRLFPGAPAPGLAQALHSRGPQAQSNPSFFH